MWRVSHKYDRDAAKLADGHYSRRTVGAPQFMPPGETLVLVAPGAVFGWWRPRSGLAAMNGLDGWTCSIFRNTSDVLSSEMVLEAEAELARADTAGPCGPDGMITYVWPRKVRSTNPGFCFLVVGWAKTGRSAGGGARRKLLLQKPLRLAGVAACAIDSTDAIARAV